MIAPFVTQLRTRGDAIDLSDGVAQSFMIRGQVLEAWDAIRVIVSGSTPMRTVKRAVLETLLADGSDPADYMAKVGGTEIRDESASLETCGVRAGTTVLVHARRRRPIR